MTPQATWLWRPALVKLVCTIICGITTALLLILLVVYDDPPSASSRLSKPAPIKSSLPILQQWSDGEAAAVTVISDDEITKESMSTETMTTMSTTTTTTACDVPNRTMDAARRALDALLGIATPTTPAPTTATPRPEWLFVGDSHVFNWHHPDLGLSAWNRYMTGSIESGVPGDGVRDTTVHLAGLRHDVAEPRGIWIWSGQNDYHLTADERARDLLTAADAVRVWWWSSSSPAMTIVIQVPPPLGKSSPYSDWYAETMDAMERRLRDGARIRPGVCIVRFTDVVTDLGDRDESLFADALHMNAAGYERYARWIVGMEWKNATTMC